jgi:hypothetical protein
MHEADADALLSFQMCHSDKVAPLCLDPFESDSGAELDAFDDTEHDAQTAPHTVSIRLDFEPNALLFCPDRDALMIADDTHARVVSWTEQGGFSMFADACASESECHRLGQIARLASGGDPDSRMWRSPPR